MCAETPDYKSTLNLPRTDFPMRAGLPKREPLWLQRWAEIGIYDRLRQKQGRKPFILHDGPPYANGHLHIGHALNKILKDMIVRSQQMLGRDARYIPGWDCHGLPIEWKIEEQYRSKGKNKDDVPINELRGECRKFAEHWVNIQREEFKRLGVQGNWDDPYLTMKFSSEAVIAEEFMKFVMNGSLYRGSKPVMWSPVEKTALAEAEIEYHDHQSHTIWVKFPFANASGDLAGASAVIWTTTPWTIPSNKAVAYNPNINYGLFRVDETQDESWAAAGDTYVLADALAEATLTSARVVKFTRIRDVAADELAGLICKHPFADSDPFWDYPEGVPMIDGDHVTDDAGTGFVHTAPSHGADDYECFIKRGWSDRLTHNINEDSAFEEFVPFFAGLEVFTRKGKEGKANPAVIAKLIEVNALIARGRVKHSYPHSWRSKAPVIFRNTPQWFVAIDKELNDGMDTYGKTIRSRALTEIDNVKWTPPKGRNRIYAMIESRPDWVMSRQRAWGVPLTCFIRDAGNGQVELLRDAAVNARIAEAFRAEGADAWFKDGARERFLEGVENADQWQMVTDILDVWFDSGSTHAFVLRDREDGSEDGIADLYLEGTDQHRGWFHSSLLQSCGTNGRAPYRGVLTHGFTLDEKGMKMSKSLGNTIVPEQVTKQYGADILRLWVAQVDFTADQRIGPEILKNVADSYRRLRNTMRFMLGSLADFDAAKAVPADQMPELERWVLHRLSELDQVVRSGYDAYDFQGVFQALFQFATVDLSAFYFDIRKDAERLTKWLAPILVFTMEEVWLQRHDGEDVSLHLEDMPTTPAEWRDDVLAAKWEALRKVRRVVTGAIEIQRQDKVIGASLEAAPTVHIRDAEVLALAKSVEFADICITSQVQLSNDPIPDAAFRMPEIEGIGVEFEKAQGGKCQRCWKILPDVGQHTHEQVCGRCDEALS
ncbi:MAG: isoleucine--tRNA ligase [Rhodobacterales bacterium]|nr:MAG: isoleucine--tRNA ligase [Rhodobacterales bacterium]